MNLSSFLMVSHAQPRHPQEDAPQLFSHGELYNILTILRMVNLSSFLMVSHTQPRHPQGDEPQLLTHGELIIV